MEDKEGLEFWESMFGNSVTAIGANGYIVNYKDFLEFIKSRENKLVEQARIKYERSGMAFVHATVIDLTNDEEMLKRLDNVVQDRINLLQNKSLGETS